MAAFQQGHPWTPPLRPPASTLPSPERPPLSRAHGHRQLGQCVCSSRHPCGVQGAARPQQPPGQTAELGPPRRPTGLEATRGSRENVGRDVDVPHQASLAFLQGALPPCTQHTRAGLGSRVLGS